MTTQTISPDALPPVSFIQHSSFDELPAEAFLYISEGSIYSDREAAETLDLDGCGDFELLTDLPLLSPAGETFLFRKMNYLKHCAEQARLLHTEEGDRQSRRFNDDADAVRNHIAECNLRLVISIARKFSNSHCDFDDLMSEGNEILLKAITKFDFSRGFRFSICADNRDGLLHDITQLVGDMHLALTGTTGRVSKADSQAIITLEMQLNSWAESVRFVSYLQHISGVHEIDCEPD